MARDPGSIWAPLPEAGAPDGYIKTQFIVHSTGDNGTAAATRRYFEGVTPNESTFIVGQGPWDPTLQIMDSTDRADANMSASIRAISVEVVGDGVGGYNAWQRSEIIRIGLWAREQHSGILPRVIPTHTEPGYGWHVMFGAPGPWAGVAKSCPGKQRIKELQNDIFPAIFAGTHPEETFMSALSAAEQRELYNRVMGRDIQRYMRQEPNGDPVILRDAEDAKQQQGWPARSVDIADVLQLRKELLAGGRDTRSVIDASNVADADRDARLAAQLGALGTDPAAIVEALRAGLGDDFAKQVVAELGKQLAG